MKFKADNGDIIEVRISSDVLTLVFSWAETKPDAFDAVIRLRGKESNEVIQHINQLGEK